MWLRRIVPDVTATVHSRFRTALVFCRLGLRPIADGQEYRSDRRKGTIERRGREPPRG
ncbi:hypothetical protein NJ7G_2943 [Natrinema sp. J7-2]|nr:hypothetical protein NJ7G_2943 [Natrinema sp. J7-2]